MWLVGGILGLAGAALAGALVMKTLQPATAVISPATVSVATPLPVAPPVATEAATPHSNMRANGTTQVPPRVSTNSHNAPHNPAAATPMATNRVAACASCGTVESVDAVQVKGEGTGLGAIAGGVLGGVVGHQVGGGNGKTAMTVLGAVGGGLAGNEVERATRSATTYDIRVRMEDGSHRVIRQLGLMTVGSHVVVDGDRLRAAG